MILYKYYITYTTSSATATREVFPLGVPPNSDNLKLKDVREEGRIFTRKKLEGRLTFTDRANESVTDYSLFYSLDSNTNDKCSEIDFEIQRSCDNGSTYESFWLGYFSTTDGTFDTDKCIFTTEVKPDDEYRCFIEGLDNEINLSTVHAHGDGFATLVTQYEFWTCRDTEGNCNAARPLPILDDNGAQSWKVFHTEIVDSVTTTIYFREVAVVACQNGSAVPPSGSGWARDVSYSFDCANGLAKFVRRAVATVTNNPNPDVGAGTCDDDDIASIPPRAKILDVTISSSRTTPAITGPDCVTRNTGGFGSCDTRFIYTIEYADPDSTFNWTTSDGNITVVSGQGTSQAVFNFDVLGTGFTITCTETSSCGVLTASTINVDVVSLGVGATCPISLPFTCVDSVCAWQDNIVLKIPKFFVGDGGILTFSYVPSISAGSYLYQDYGDGYDTYLLNLDAVSDAVDTVTFSLSVNGSAGCTPNWTLNHTITKTGNHKTQDIRGASSVCPSATMFYNVQGKVGATYEWTVTGGTIASGQGTQTINVDWGSAGSGVVSVKETLNCTCSWIRLTSNLPNDASGCEDGPSYYWCPTDNTFEIINNSTFEDIINFIKDELCIGLDAKSDFFEWDAPGDTSGYTPGINYVTGQANQLTYISLIPLRAMIYSFTGNAEYLNATQDEVLSWSDIEEILREVFNAYWFLDENGNLRIEHYSWFNRTVAYDLTDSFYRKYSVGKNIYSYDKIKAPKFERFKWQQAVNTDFIGAEISYSGTCINTNSRENVKNRGVTWLNTDIIYLNTLGTEMGRNGFALLCFDSTFSLQSEIGLISGLLLPNAHLSWANLHYNYHRHNRVLLNGRMNLQDMVFLSALRFKKQEPVSFPYCCVDELNILTDLITTNIGDGIVEEATHNLKNDMLTVTLYHDF